ncbi:uncharacterized protein LOC134441123 [Engraulis encrasicolus]|uniref:uncharacterized protein LOC134441123 n=1 Tax=Engraulis encrasicolus TaxID=184585 RepID=UPI002FCFDDAB
MTLPELLGLCVLCLVPVASREAPSFCHEADCPEYTVIHTYPDFEERLYKPSHWLTVDIPEVNMEPVINANGEIIVISDLKRAFFTLYDYTKGENEEKAEVELPWPSIVQVEEEGDERHGSASRLVPPGTHLPKANADTIEETHLPAIRVYVRSFIGGESDVGYEELSKLRASVTAMGKNFVPHRFVAASYDRPWDLINRRSEMCIGGSVPLVGSVVCSSVICGVVVLEAWVTGRGVVVLVGRVAGRVGWVLAAMPYVDPI